MVCTFTVTSDITQVINHYYKSLENYMDADSVSHMMHCEQLITDSDYEAITAAPSDSKINALLLQYVRSMNVSQLSRYCNILKSIETPKVIRNYTSVSKYLKSEYICVYMYVCTYSTNHPQRKRYTGVICMSHTCHVHVTRV